QRLPAVFAFEEERFGLEVPVDHAREVVAVTERVAQHAHQRGLALDRRQPLAAEAELEHPRLPTARLPREPDFAAEGAVERALEPEVLAARYRLAGLERHRAVEALADGDALHRAVEPVADSRHGGDTVFAGGVQRAAQLADGGGQHVVDGDPAGPDL